MHLRLNLKVDTFFFFQKNWNLWFNSSASMDDDI